MGRDLIVVIIILIDGFKYSQYSTGEKIKGRAAVRSEGASAPHEVPHSIYDWTFSISIEDKNIDMQKTEFY